MHLRRARLTDDGARHGFGEFLDDGQVEPGGGFATGRLCALRRVNLPKQFLLILSALEARSLILMPMPT